MLAIGEAHASIPMIRAVPAEGEMKTHSSSHGSAASGRGLTHGALLWIILLAALGQPVAAAPSQAATAEIEHLMSHLGQSGCSFYRNGTWHSAQKAEAHLRGKYAYLLRKDLLTTAESFIERAASQSSMSGQAYQVRCEGEPVENSADWFQTELERFRAQP